MTLEKAFLDICISPQIYCAGMHLENPKEYISLVKGEEDNFSEVYGFRYELCFSLSLHFDGP